ncbi:MAG: hypothetical protein NTX82_03945 [Candidatus Parcubacteria bacterium]|nr:hypothetical protein [Candidatus Parcubacteria bacterium]
MPKQKTDKKGLGNLVNFTLICDKKRLMMTSDDLAKIQAIKRNLEEHAPTDQYIIEHFGVDISARYSMSVTVHGFKKNKGYSLWQVMK